VAHPKVNHHSKEDADEEKNEAYDENGFNITKQTGNSK
jgi:hypothetical protein